MRYIKLIKYKKFIVYLHRVEKISQSLLVFQLYTIEMNTFGNNGVKIVEKFLKMIII